EPPDAPARARTVVQAELVDLADPSRADTEVVRRRSRRAHPDSAPPRMDEALSMLAFLQAQQHQAVHPIAGPAGTQRAAPMDPAATRPMPAVEPPAAPRPKVEDPADAEPLPELRPRVGGKLAFLALGLALGVAGTLGAQAFLPRQHTLTPLPALADAPAADRVEIPPVAVPPVEVPPVEVPPPVEETPSAAVTPEEPPPEDTPPPLEVPVPAPAPAVLTIAYPKGARVRLDGKLLPGRVPLEAIPLEPGAHEVKVVKGRYKKQVELNAEPGARYELKRHLEQLQ
ncbi:MAG: PEGA domain-containing protein, partial [Myxococcales bacterium]|nr:PEGA domain-containing protein [Myxococcales bacterium]